MKLKKLLEKITYECISGSLDREVNAVVYDSRKVTENCVFICIEGANFDGHKFANEVVKKGATVLVVQKEVDEALKYNPDVTILKVENTRYAMAFISAAYFGHPAEQMKIIGITGTKGKTTTTYMVKSILENAGLKVGLIGTIEVIIGDTHIPANNTTPESYLLQEYFAQMVKEGCDCVVMEVSSQALMLHRTQGFEFDFGIFTNLEPDHIGPNEHESFEDYMACKGLLFKQCKVGIVNSDDAHYRQVVEGHTCKLETYGLKTGADLLAWDLQLLKEEGTLGVNFKVSGLDEMEVYVATPGRFSVYNALTAIAICRHFKVSKEAVAKALRQVKVKGRIEPVKVSDDFTLLIDYAHNAMSMESLLATLRDYHPKRLVCVFGCGGNRAKDRRYSMGEIGGKMADLCVITADNPRFEKNEDIIKDIEIGLAKTNGSYIVIPDRREAIFTSIHNAKEGDMVAIIGKGHEDYQEIEGVRHHFKDREVVEDAVKEMA